jgi:hypothetical protein
MEPAALDQRSTSRRIARHTPEGLHQRRKLDVRTPFLATGAKYAVWLIHKFFLARILDHNGDGMC